jgi:hypothetical protein
MAGYMTYLVVQAKEAELAAKARRPEPEYAVLTEIRSPGRFRTATARLMVALAIRLDDRLRPSVAVGASTAGAHG